MKTTREYVYETTPYSVVQRGNKFVVRQSWHGRDISEHDTQDAADAACLETARQNGSLKRIRI